MNFGIKQTFKRDDLQRDILSLVELDMQKTDFFVENLYVSANESSSAVVEMEKTKSGWTEVSFVSTFNGGTATLKLTFDGVPFFEKTLTLANGSFFSYSKKIFSPVGLHVFGVEIISQSSANYLSDARFCVTGNGVKSVFCPQISFEKGLNGQELYVARYADGYYLFCGELTKDTATRLTFAEESLPQKVKIKYFLQKIYILYKAVDGRWKISLLDQQNAVVPIGASLAVGSDCDFLFKTEQSGEVYFVAQGDLYRFCVNNLFETQTTDRVQKVVFEEVNQKVRGVYVSPYEYAQEESVGYLAVWGVDAVITALISIQNQEHYLTVVKVLSDPYGQGVFAMDNIFFVGVQKKGLLGEYRVFLAEEGVSVSFAKKRYCPQNTAVAKTLEGFAFFDDGNYLLT